MKLLLILILTFLKLIQSSSVLYGSIATIKESDLNKECYNQLQIIKNEFDNKKIWALKMIDSSGSDNSGFILGNNFWFGSRDECNMIEKPDYIPLNNEKLIQLQENIIGSQAPFGVKFWMVIADYNTTNQFCFESFSEVCTV